MKYFMGSNKVVDPAEMDEGSKVFIWQFERLRDSFFRDNSVKGVANGEVVVTLNTREKCLAEARQQRERSTYYITQNGDRIAEKLNLAGVVNYLLIYGVVEAFTSGFQVVNQDAHEKVDCLPDMINMVKGTSSGGELSRVYPIYSVSDFYFADPVSFVNFLEQCGTEDKPILTTAEGSRALDKGELDELFNEFVAKESVPMQWKVENSERVLLADDILSIPSNHSSLFSTLEGSCPAIPSIRNANELDALKSRIKRGSKQSVLSRTRVYLNNKAGTGKSELLSLRTLRRYPIDDELFESHFVFVECYGLFAHYIESVDELISWIGKYMHPCEVAKFKGL